MTCYVISQGGETVAIVASLGMARAISECRPWGEYSIEPMEVEGTPRRNRSPRRTPVEGRPATGRRPRSENLLWDLSARRAYGMRQRAT